MFRKLLSAFRRRTPSPPASRATPVGEANVTIVAQAPSSNLPRRAPGLATARRHTWDATSHAIGAIRDADAYADARLDPARTDEAHVRHIAALHQLDAALEHLSAARAALTRSTR